ncbi:flagellar biosynthetic protein FliP [Sulfobacillus thermosulfidooxidans DSM 9293]|uniref:Flagellar biosynthetic protein FliP n=1 Tax=Sulfobacillus thermosulfidooxidans (strain DSM 9293 / VKM B-1269 / AT-1) TaxID=929705 RepID=A0A1W1WE78_SULTA|nr:flagellar type III secretion system pore protein FliP [Sulfobacillus thermosulfidooxidans]SMC04594.1 flagellar biosynthetic protein FliP [Sulfobacillus thermosulfidooxidans DSM 9293]
MKLRVKRTLWVLATVIGTVITGPLAFAQGPSIPQISVSTHGSSSPSQVISILALLTLLSFLPAILLTMTAFTRVITVLAFVRSALGLQQTPPNQVLIGLALFLTFFIMAPTFGQIDHQALIPYLHGQIGLERASVRALDPLRVFMYQQTRPSDLALFLHLDHVPPPKNLSQVPTVALIPAFIISELKTAFEIGVYIFIPFMIVDLVVSTVLMSLGMMMVPPTLISLPLKLLLFVLANGWNLVVQSLVMSFHGVR